MTCIVGLVDSGVVHMGADSAGMETSTYHLMSRADEKVFRNGRFLIGFTTSFRMGQLLRHKFTPPAPPRGVDIVDYMVTDFIAAVRKTFAVGGWLLTRNERVEGGEFLVGVAGRLFHVFSDFQVGERKEGFDAAGCGEAFALGALMANAHLPPGDRVLQALEVAECFSAGVRRPFVVCEAHE